MFTFTFDREVYFYRATYDDCWHACTDPKLCKTDFDSWKQGYFRVRDGKFDHHPKEGQGFEPDEIRRIETLLSEKSDEMDLEQFELHEHLPSHYKAISKDSNKYRDLLERMRIHGHGDPNLCVAFEQLTSEEPAYRLTRQFIARVIERAEWISDADRDAWLEEVMRDSWTYDVQPYAKPGETYEHFYLQEVRNLMLPTPMSQREKTNSSVYKIDGLPDVYMVEDREYVEITDSPLIDSRHYYDRGSVLVPMPVPGRGGKSYYLL